LFSSTEKKSIIIFLIEPKDLAPEIILIWNEVSGVGVYFKSILNRFIVLKTKAKENFLIGNNRTKLFLLKEKSFF